MPHFQVEVTNLGSNLIVGVIDNETLEKKQELFNCELEFSIEIGFCRNTSVSFYVTADYVYIYKLGKFVDLKKKRFVGTFTSIIGQVRTGAISGVDHGSKVRGYNSKYDVYKSFSRCKVQKLIL